jgi:hypothetical protein
MTKRKTDELQSAPLGAPAAALSASTAEARTAEPVTGTAASDTLKPVPAGAETDVLPGAEPPKLETAAPAPASTPTASARANRFAPLAATVALAAAFGALVGALGASGFARSTPAPVGAATAATLPQEIQNLPTTIEQIRSELAALRTNVDASSRNGNAQFGKITERFDRIERAQTERAARLTKAAEILDRLERRADIVPAKETTGSIAAQPVAATPATVPAAAPPASPQSPNVPGWTVRDVYRGVAVVQRGRSGLMEVEAGDTVPYLGRIESIRRKDGHWVVVTSKGVITSVR